MLRCGRFAAWVPRLSRSRGWESTRAATRHSSTEASRDAASAFLRSGQDVLAADAAAAADAFGKARVAFHSNGDSAGEANAVLGLARAQRALGNAAAMVSHLREYLRLKGDVVVPHEDLAWVSYELGFHGYALGDFASSLRFLQAARMSAKLAGNTKVEADSLVYLGALYARRSEHDKGIQLMQRGVNLMLNAGDETSQRRVLLMMGRIQHEAGRLDDAIASYSAATVLARKANDIRGESGIYRQAGAVLKDKGELRSALMSFRVALKLSDQSGDKLGIVLSALQTGNALDEIAAGTPESLHYWKLALRVCGELDPKARRSLPLRSEALFRIIQHYESHKLYAVALPYRQEQAQLMSDAKLPRGHATALLDVAELLARVGRTADAASTYTQAAELWKTLGEPVYEATARVGLSRAMLQQARLHEARVEAMAAKALVRASGPKPRSEYNVARVRAMAGVADMLARTGALDDAHRLATAALASAEGAGGGRDADAACAARLALARTLMQEKHYDDAHKRATEALTHAIAAHHQPLIHAGLELLGELALRKGLLDKADEYFSKLAKFDETRISAMQHLAAVAERRPNAKLAIRLHMDAVAAAHDQPHVAFRSLNALSRLHEEQGNEAQAQTYKRMCAHLASPARDKV